MRNKSITFKLFAITSAFFIFFLMVTAVAQTLFFERFYIYQKVNRLEKSIEDFANLYEGRPWDQKTIVKNINKFIDQNNAQVAILNERGAPKYVHAFDIVVENAEKERITIPLNNIMMMEVFQELNVTVGSDVKLEGIFTGEKYGTFYPFRIQMKGSPWLSLNQLTPAVNKFKIISIPKTAEFAIQAQPGKIAVQKGDIPFEVAGSKEAQVIQINMENIEGKIVEVNLPERRDNMAPYKEDMFWSAVDQWFWVANGENFAFKDDEVIRYPYKNPMNGIDNVVLVKPIIEDGRLREMIFTMTSLQPVGEAAGVMKDYYIYLFLLAGLLIMALSYIYSKMVAKPLIQINNAAVKMANLDFSVTCDSTSTDEIGSLANSLNSLSKNLSRSMADLQTTNEKLKVEIEKERSLEKMRKEFVSSVSHELKTPLGIMKGYAEGLKDGIAEEKKEYYLEVILDEIGKMDVLVLDMLELSKLESKAYQLKKQNFSIHSLIDEVAHRFIQQVQKKGLRLKHIYEEDECWCYGDMWRIEQVIVNLLSNAIRHAPVEGNIHIYIKTREDQVVIGIENEGQPIPEEKMDRIWDRFYRLEEARGRQSGGTGLGLAIVKNILELHGSEYGVRNTDMGVEFFFTLAKGIEA
ncbi:signal transduction histidine kinase [Anaerosolibacter carboniphilus]|uniref:histidine kinase n=1 Tax=Anaerosolibacter carboniphilus TaxID=1417629 RepID=A0A841KPF1_9FIRM|nr:ATP-binding protein [Anaerosolibacter carboniphilus]MBB6215317.1 signal transduction histidine kinase [Anaerosolibacter carboniphilus]